MSLRVKRLSQTFATRPFTSPQLFNDKGGYSLSEARDIYLRLKGKEKVSTFHSAATRNCQYAIESIGDNDLSIYRSDDGAKFRDHLVCKGLTGSSIKQIFSTFKSVINLTNSEYGLDKMALTNRSPYKFWAKKTPATQGFFILFAALRT